MPFWQALLYFGLPALLFRISSYNGILALARLRLTPFEAYMVGLTIPAANLFALAFGFCAHDGYAHSWSSIKTRFWLHAMTKQDWVWTVVAGAGNRLKGAVAIEIK